MYFSFLVLVTYWLCVLYECCMYAEAMIQFRFSVLPSSSRNYWHLGRSLQTNFPLLHTEHATGFY